ncbi:hypothetical protein JW968_01960 [Candidatus Woesearchaeota archaeon]|nr:hypothetical protein [Candidatus Woesearchaeota archaeon]
MKTRKKRQGMTGKMLDLFRKSVLFRSFRDLSSLPWQIVYDSLFFAVSLVSVLLFSMYFVRISLDLQPLMDYAQLVQQTMIQAVPGNLPDVASLYGMLSQNRQVWYAFVAKTVFSFIVLFGIIILAQSFFRLLIYDKVISRKWDSRRFYQFFMLNLAWYGSGLLVFIASFFFSFSLLPVFVFFFLCPLYLYFTPILYLIFRKRGLICTVTSALDFGLRKVHHFLLHMLVIVLVFFLVSWVSYPFGRFSIYPWILVMLFLLLLGWARVYYHLLVRRLEVCP